MCGFARYRERHVRIVADRKFFAATPNFAWYRETPGRKALSHRGFEA